ncbi:hypothetical protein Pmar_PMAR006488 [Perkinsus marinus ATCC 50983]|uniref:EF-hand domain-containing protein n=1 Tax=Perkinsus marinus (strain ATCC 50983 / TXsc) TaxID=423536 RepID=C5K9U2_PERM5|nr:hypothetical protein Pmar_PMAR006488 [Perkinsus marinus ATCC 50983]EER18864.1 hypothetical protein Pmar_PMAR006488 [Perkinsus marinus ATCC 50983]|eukprot:XP_002787068.1 hypothetical protein Pmar_PMAR006488 [Perkinsus marinus ATCC 50983]
MAHDGCISADLGRESARRHMRERALDTRYPPIIVFPTATCNNMRQLTEFKTGAFDTGLPVQPIGLSYPCRYNDLYLDDNVLGLLYRTLCEFVNNETITFLPMYSPTPAERKDPTLYAEGVRKVMCRELGRVAVPFVFEDEMLRNACGRNQMHLCQYRLMMKDIFQEFNTSDRVLEYWVSLLHSVDVDGDGFVSARDVREKFRLGADEARCLDLLIQILKQDDPNGDTPWSVPADETKGWYSKIFGGIPAVPHRPEDVYVPNALAVHEIIPMLLVLYTAPTSGLRCG